MAAVQMFPRVLRQAANMPLVSAAQAVPATASKKYIILSDIGAADLADATLWVLMQIDVEDATQPGGWLANGGGAVKFQLGPYTDAKTGVVSPGGKDRGFQVNAADLAGKNVRFVGECRFVPAGTNPETVLPNWQTFAFHNITMGVTREAVG